MEVHLYSDGGCFNHGARKGDGAWAYILVQDDKVLHQASGFEVNTTNNRMEYLSYLKGLAKCVELQHNNIIAYSDSELLVKTWNEWLAGWMQPIAATPLQMGNLLLAATAPA